MIFISYSSKDEEFSNKIYENSIQFGLNVFMAKHSISAGETWSNTILDHLRKSKVVIYITSKNSLESKSVQHELGGALFDKKIIIPLLIDIEPEELPSWIAEYQAVNINDIDKLNEKLAHLVTKSNNNKISIGLVIASIVLAVLAGINHYKNKRN